MNRNTIRNDPLLKRGLNMVITINFEHTHNVQVAEAFSYLRMDKNTEDIFLKYFEGGITASASRAFQEISLIETIEDTKLPILLAHGREKLNIYMINGGVQTMGIAMKKVSFRKSTVLVREHPIIIAVFTPIMKRAHECRCAQEVVFVDFAYSTERKQLYISIFDG
ncbi:uncharacterized protein LOC130900328 [Diorhabda carinulata]|uniref:uncharacterized protein LOC130900328 n=1 Tax=Diorhabda carinulata TaxID=1163345 RepID=UPI00259FF719|nr:uncharacterized protein LOC130900328 [Diorhabda carinulata]